MSERSSRAQTFSAPPREARGESLVQLLVQLVRALLRAALRPVPVEIINRVISSCALVALVSPLLLWFSWSRAGFFIIIGTAAAAIALIYLLAWLFPEDPF